MARCGGEKGETNAFVHHVCNITRWHFRERHVRSTHLLLRPRRGCTVGFVFIGRRIFGEGPKIK